MAYLLLADGAQTRAAVNVDTSFFHERLTMHGRWVQRPPYGWVWFPTTVAVGWRPYTIGTERGPTTTAGSGPRTRSGDGQPTTTGAGPTMPNTAGSGFLGPFGLRSGWLGAWEAAISVGRRDPQQSSGRLVRGSASMASTLTLQ